MKTGKIISKKYISSIKLSPLHKFILYWELPPIDYETCKFSSPPPPVIGPTHPELSEGFREEWNHGTVASKG